jgi:hypothetical protein
MRKMRTSSFGLRRRWAWLAIAACLASAATSGCELIVDFDRSKIEEEGGALDATTDDSSAPDSTTSEGSTGMDSGGDSTMLSDGPGETGSDTGTTQAEGGAEAGEAGMEASVADAGTDTGMAAETGADTGSDAGITGADADASSGMDADGAGD